MTRNDTSSTYGTWDFTPRRTLSRRARIERLDRLSRLLDTAILIPGTNIRFGADAVIGLVLGIVATPSPRRCPSGLSTRRTSWGSLGT